MSSVQRHIPISVADYLHGEADARHKHEYVEGVGYAMVGTTNAHNRIATNGTGTLYAQLRGKQCQVFNADTKVRIRTSQGTRFYYPDLSVVFRLNPPSDSFQDNPAVIVEVISDSTRRNDELEKKDAYLSIDSLSVYILAEQSTASAIVYRRTDTGFARETYLNPTDVIPLPEIQCELSFAELYENVEFPPPSDNQDDAI